MTDSMDIKKLTEFRCQINNNVVESIKESVTKLNEAMAMIADLQNINETLVLELAENQKENQSKDKELCILKQEIESMKKDIRRVEEKEKLYNSMDLSMIELTKLSTSLKERENTLSLTEKELNENKQKFESERKSIISARLDAEEKAKFYSNNNVELSKAIDIATVERDNAIEAKTKAENDLLAIKNELNEYRKASAQEKEELNEKIVWYYKYAKAVDQKIVDFFRSKNDDLNRHYNTYLNNPDELEEIRKHFPDYSIEEKHEYVSNYSWEEKYVPDCNIEEHEIEIIDNDEKDFEENEVIEDKNEKNHKKKISTKRNEKNDRAIAD